MIKLVPQSGSCSDEPTTDFLKSITRATDFEESGDATRTFFDTGVASGYGLSAAHSAPI